MSARSISGESPPTAPCPLHPTGGCAALSCEKCSFLLADAGGDISWVCHACARELKVPIAPFFAYTCCAVCGEHRLTHAVTTARL